MPIRGVAALLAAGVVLAGAAQSIAPAWAADDCTALGGVLEADSICHVQANQSTYTMDVRFPVNYPDQQAIVGYLTENRDGFINVAQMPGSRNLPYQMDVTTQSFTSAQTQSVVLKLFQDVGGAHPVTWYKSFTYDTAQRRPIAFENLFAKGAKPLEAIFPIVKADLQRQTGLTPLPDVDGLDPVHYQNFAITDDAVIFFFGRAELLPSYAGATSVSVPRTAIPALEI